MKIRISSWLAVAVLLSTAALAQSPEEMEAWQRAMTPGAPHADLAQQAGAWKYVLRIWSEPGVEPLVLEGVSTKTMIMGGRYLQEELNGEFMGQPFTGFGITGYDNVAGEFVSIWLDNMGTGISLFKGRSDDSGAHVYDGEQLTPTGEPMKTRSVGRTIDADHHNFESYVKQPDGSEHLHMRVEYTRAGAVARRG